MDISCPVTSFSCSLRAISISYVQVSVQACRIGGRLDKFTGGKFRGTLAAIIYIGLLIIFAHAQIKIRLVRTRENSSFNSSNYSHVAGSSIDAM